MLINDNMKENGYLSEIPQQSNFYKETVVPVIDNSRAFVIISDALRFEVATELSDMLIRETNGTAKISAIQSVFPSATKYAMAALLPHDSLTMTDDIKILCDDLPTDGTINRDIILKKQCENNVAIKYQELLTMKQAERRQLINGADVVYIYHNTIDAVGDKSDTEEQVFEACEDTIIELKNLVKLIVNSMSGTNIFITADHGFLYSSKPLNESDNADQSLIEGDICEIGRRYVIAEENSHSDILTKLPLDIYNTKKCGFAPNDIIRIKKQGGGINYVHGGLSLQECTVPVIRFKNIRTDSKKFTDIKKVTLQLLSQTRRICNNIFSLDFYQRDAVSGKTVPATYELYICDEMSQTVSDIQTIIADKTNPEPQDRITHLRFTLKGQEYNSTNKYYLNIVEKDTADIKEHIEFEIKNAFANDFGF